MAVALFANPRSGSGRAARLAGDAEVVLRAAGHRVTRYNVGPGLPPVDTAAALAGATVAVAAGGDGTVRSLAPACIATRTPIYHLPSGNENLFAREFGMDRNPATLVRALRRARVTMCDVGTYTRESAATDETRAGSDTLDDRALFLLMASIGPDAGVCHRLHATRAKGSGGSDHRAYLSPIYHEFQAPSITRLRISCDGNLEPAAAGRGMVVIANCRQYGLRIDPCPLASNTDGLLDAAFIPADTAVDAVAALARLRFRCPTPDIVRLRARRIRVEFEGATTHPSPLHQVDGEADVLDHADMPKQAIEYAVKDGVLPVLDAR